MLPNYPSYTGSSSLAIVKEMWEKYRMQSSSGLDAYSIFSLSNVVAGSSRLSSLLDYAPGVRDQENMLRDGWDANGPSTTFHRYAYFPVVGSNGGLEIWAAFFTSIAPTGHQLVDTATWDSMRVLDFPKIPGLKFFSFHVTHNRSSILSIVSSLEMCSEYINKMPYSGEKYAYVTHLGTTTAPESFSTVGGSSMGFAMAAAILGCPPVLYTGYVQAFDASSNIASASDRYKVDDPNSVVANYTDWSNQPAQIKVYSQLFPDDNIKAVQEIPLKLAISIYTGCPLMLPHIPIFKKTILKLKLLLNLTRITNDAMYPVDFNQLFQNGATDSAKAGIQKSIMFAMSKIPGASAVSPDAASALINGYMTLMTARIKVPDLLNKLTEMVNTSDMYNMFRTSQNCLVTELLPTAPTAYLVTSLAENCIVSRFLNIQGNSSQFDFNEIMRTIFNAEAKYHDAKNVWDTAAAVRRSQTFGTPEDRQEFENANNELMALRRSNKATAKANRLTAKEQSKYIKTSIYKAGPKIGQSRTSKNGSYAVPLGSGRGVAKPGKKKQKGASLLAQKRKASKEFQDRWLNAYKENSALPMLSQQQLSMPSISTATLPSQTQQSTQQPQQQQYVQPPSLFSQATPPVQQPAATPSQLQVAPQQPSQQQSQSLRQLMGTLPPSTEERSGGAAFEGVDEEERKREREERASQLLLPRSFREPEEEEEAPVKKRTQSAKGRKKPSK